MSRGVRLVFAILAKRGQVPEWSPQIRDFVPVVGEIRDPSLRMPLLVQALLQASEADDAVARALLDKGNPVLARLRMEGESAGRREGEIAGRREGEESLRQALQSLCLVLGIEFTETRQAVLDKANLADLRGLIQTITMQRRWPGD